MFFYNFSSACVERFQKFMFKKSRERKNLDGPFSDCQLVIVTNYIGPTENKDYDSPSVTHFNASPTALSCK